MVTSPGQSTGKTTGVVGYGDVIDVTLSLDTSIYADNDVLAAPQEVTGFFRTPGGRAILQNLVLLDESDQGSDIDLIFMDADGSLGAENAALGPTDTVARSIIGTVSLLASANVDLANSQLMVANGIGMMLKAASGSTSVWIGAVVRSGTPTYAASGIRLKLACLWD
jgi:hypothetical protein